MAEQDTSKAAGGLSCPSISTEALDAPVPAIAPSPSLSAAQALAAAFHHVPRPPLDWRAGSVSEATMASGMVAMKRAMAVGLRD